VTARPGEWLIPWPGQRYQDFSDDAEILSVRFRAVWPDGRPLFDRGLSVKFAAREHPALEQSARALLGIASRVMPAEPRELVQTAVAFGDFIAVNCAFQAWLGCFHTTLCAVGLKPARLGIHDERIVAALQTLDSVGVAERLREHRLATAAGLGVSQFVRLFRQELGETPRQYFEQRRRAYACDMIASTAVPIKEIAHSLGMARLSDFSAWFKQHQGKSPRQFRDEVREALPV
jgi:AraC-like DNA-binding protein